jgi:ABC-2 type transport system ATP-binding protein
MSAAPAVTSAIAISIVGLTKDFPVNLRGLKVRAVDQLSLSIPANEIFGLLGPNGSGKSTTIKAILGLVAPTVGECHIFGERASSVRSRFDVGYLPEAPYFYRYLTGRELVTFYARVCQVPRPRLRARVDEVLSWVGLEAAADRRVGTYSKGMLQRIGLAQALVHDPRLLILDEPTAGVDPVGSAEMAKLIVGLKAQGRTVLICSHLLAQIEDICDRVAILNRGRLVLEGRVEDLVAEKGRRSIVVEGLPATEEPELRDWLQRRGARLIGVETPRTTLDRVFLDHVASREDATQRPDPNA